MAASFFEVPTEDQARRHRKRVLALCAAALAAGLLAAAAALLWLPGPLWWNRVVVVNSGPEPLRSVALALRETEGDLRLERSRAELAPGGRWIVRRVGTDFSLDLRFDLRGSPRRHRENYVDLWTGEDWVLEVEADGSVRSRHGGD